MAKTEILFHFAIENAQVWLVIATQSPVIGQRWQYSRLSPRPYVLQDKRECRFEAGVIKP